MFDFASGLWRPDPDVVIEVTAVPAEAPESMTLNSPDTGAIMFEVDQGPATNVPPGASPSRIQRWIMVFASLPLHVLLPMGIVRDAEGQPHSVQAMLKLGITDPARLARHLPRPITCTAVELGQMLATTDALRAATSDALQGSPDQIQARLVQGIGAAIASFGLGLIDQQGSARTVPDDGQVSSLRQGQVIAGRYRLLRVLGEGYFAQVWLVQDAHNGVERALKVVLKPEHAQSVRREARRLAHFERAHIDWQYLARLMDVVPDNTACIVYEYIQGPDLLHYVRGRGGFLPAGEAIAIIAQVLAGLTEVHRAGVIHRDLHPGNIKVSREAPEVRIKILDFGLAWPLPVATNPDALYGGSALGIEPRNAWAEGRRHPGIPPDVRTDLYSAGALLWWLLTGEHGLPEGQSLEQVRPDIPAALREVIWRASLAPRTERYASAQDMAAALQRTVGSPSESPRLAATDGPPQGLLRDPALVAQGLQQRFGKGEILQILPLAGDRALLVAKSDTSLWEALHPIPTWTIDQPANIGAVTTDGTLLALAEVEITLWNLSLGRPQSRLAGHTASVVSMAFSPDGRMLASGSWDRTIRLWDVIGGTEIRRLMGHDQLVASVAFSPDGRTLASAGSGDNTVRLWDVATGTELRRLAHARQPGSVAFGASGRILATNEGVCVRLWDAASGAELRRLEQRLPPMQLVSALCFSPDGRTLASAGAEPIVRLWDPTSGRVIRRLKVEARALRSVAFSPDGENLGMVSAQNRALLWKVTQKQPFRILSGGTEQIREAVFTSDGRMLYTWGKINAAEASYALRRWDTTSGQSLDQLSIQAKGVIRAAFSPDGRFLVTGSHEHAGTARLVQVWDTAHGRQLHALQGHTKTITGIAFSRDGSIMATGSDDRTVRLWDLSTGRELHALNRHTDRVSAVTLSPDGKILASASDDRSVRLADVASGTELVNLEGLPAAVRGVAFGADQRVLAMTCKEDAVIRLWVAGNGPKLLRLEGHSGPIECIAFSPDGYTLASASTDRSVRLWDVAAARELRRLDGLPWSVKSMVFSLDGRLLATVSLDGTVHTWRL